MFCPARIACNTTKTTCTLNSFIKIIEVQGEYKLVSQHVTKCPTLFFHKVSSEAPDARTEAARAYIAYMLQTPTLRFSNSLKRKSEDGTHT